MTNHIRLSLTLVVGLFAAAGALTAAGHDHDAMQQPAAAPTEAQAKWLADAIASYPLTTCVVSDDVLGGDMGKPVDYVYKQEGKPDRLVRFCCKDCVKDFLKDPAKYLAAVDAAAAAKKKNG